MVADARFEQQYAAKNVWKKVLNAIVLNSSMRQRMCDRSFRMRMDGSEKTDVRAADVHIDM